MGFRDGGHAMWFGGHGVRVLKLRARRGHVPVRGIGVQYSSE